MWEGGGACFVLCPWCLLTSVHVHKPRTHEAQQQQASVAAAVTVSLKSLESPCGEVA